jgi:cytidylate kinase
MEHVEPYITTRLSENRMRLWNVLHPVEQTKSSPYRFLTISRDEGTMGGEIAKSLADRLGWRLYDKEIVDHIANNSHVREDLVRQLDEKDRGMIYETILRMLRMPESTPFGSLEYHESLLKTLATIAAHGDAVLVGRGANFVLFHLDQGLHVRVIASLEARIQRLSRAWQVSPEIARQRIAAMDAERRAFIRHYFKQDINDPRYYNFLINTDRVSVSQAVDALIASLKPEVARIESRVAGN